MSIELKPCAHCAGADKPEDGRIDMRVKLDYTLKGLYFVRCGRCGIQTGEYTTQQRAVDIWNMRRQPDTIKQLSKENDDAAIPHFI